MFNFTPPHTENVAKYCGILLVVFFLSCAYMRGYQAGISSSLPYGGRSGRGISADVPEPVEIRKSLFFNPDSIAYYSAIAAREDDPRALFIVGMAAHLRAADPDYPASISTVSLDEADHYLLRAAELGNPDALQYIKCCEYHGTWKHYVPSSNH